MCRHDHTHVDKHIHTHTLKHTLTHIHADVDPGVEKDISFSRMTLDRLGLCSYFGEGKRDIISQHDLGSLGSSFILWF